MLTKKQAELMGVFKGLPITKNYFTSKFARDYFTIGETINFDEVASELAVLDIIPRGTSLSVLDAKGMKRVTVNPDILGGKSSLTTTELLELQAGQFEITKNPMSNFAELRDRHLVKLKNALYNTKERMCAEAYLTGKVKLPISKDELAFGDDKKIEKKFEKSKDNWQTFVLELVDEYHAKNGVFPTTIEVDMSIFKEIVKDETILKQASAYHTNVLKVNDKVIPAINIFGYDVIALPKAIGVDGEAIKTDNLVIVSNNETFTSAYTGIGFANGNALSIYKGEFLLEENIQKDPANYQFVLQSGFCPIIPLSDRVMRYKLTINGK